MTMLTHSAYIVSFCLFLIAFNPQEVKGDIGFRDVSAQAGIKNIGSTAGASWGDSNGDNWPDLFIGNHSFERAAPLLLLNNQRNGFEDASHKLSVPFNADLHGGAWADYDSDGDQDLIVLAGGGGGDGESPNLLLRNDNVRFTDHASEFNLALAPSRGRTPLWVDANNDGKLDLLVSNMPRPDGIAGTELFVQTQDNFRPQDFGMQFPPQSRGYFEQALYYLVNANRLRFRPFFGTINTTDVFAQIGDFNSDKIADIVVYREPTRVFSLSGSQPTPLKHIFLSSEHQVADVAIADFDGNLQSDVYIARLAAGAQSVNTETPGVVEAVFQGSKGSDAPSTLSVEAKQPLRTKIVDPWEINGALPPVFIGRDRHRPSHTTFILDPANPESHGAPAHLKSNIEVLVWFDPKKGHWKFENYAGRIHLSIEATSGEQFVKVEHTGFESRGGALRDRLLFQDTGVFESQTGPGQDTTPCGSVVAADFDNDMDVDIFLACTYPTTNAPNLLLENDGNGNFKTLTNAGGAEGTQLGRSDSVTSVDFDRDGFIDLLVTNGAGSPPFAEDGPTQLFRNTGNANHWLELVLVGRKSNPHGIGAIVHVRAGNKTQMRIQDGGMHSFAQNDSTLHFGLANNPKVEVIEIWWPSGTRQIIRDVSSNQLISVIEQPD